MASPGLPYPERFHSAALYVKQQPNLPGTKQLSQEAQLLLYALSQQAVLGSNNHPKPWAWNVVESAKWQAWKQLGSMSTVESMRLYVRTLEEEQSDWYPILLKAPRSSSHSQIAVPLILPAAVGSPISPKSNGQQQQQQQQQVTHQPLPSQTATRQPALTHARPGMWSVVPVEEGARKPLPRYEQGAAVIGNSIYVVGGNYGGRYLSDLWAFDLDHSSWKLVHLRSVTTATPEASEPAPPPLDASPATGTATATATGTAPPDPSESKVAAAAAAVSARVGAAATNMAAAVVELLKVPRVLAGSGLSPLAGHSVTAWGGRLVVVGGHSKAQPKSAPLSMAVRVVDVVTHEVELVSIAGASPSARGGHTATLIGDQLYIFGGEDPFRRALPDLWVLDLTSMTWNQPATIGRAPSARSAATAAAFLDRYLLLFGGGSVASCFADLWLLDTATLAWATPRVGGAAVGSRAGHAGAVLGSQWVIVGGGNNVKGCTDLLALDLSPLVALAAAAPPATTQPTTAPSTAAAAAAPAVTGAATAAAAAAAAPAAGSAAPTAPAPGAVAAAAAVVAESPVLTWRVVSRIPPRDPLSSEGVSVVALPKASALAAFGGYNGKYQNVLSIILAADLQIPDAAPPSAASTAAPVKKASSPSITTTGPPPSPPPPPKLSASASAGHPAKPRLPTPTPSTSRSSAEPQQQHSPPSPTPSKSAPGSSSASSASSPPPTTANGGAAPPPAAGPVAVVVDPVPVLRAALEVARREAEVAIRESAAAKEGAAAELALMRKQLMGTQAQLTDVTRGLESTRATLGAALSSEQSKVLRLEAEAAEAGKKLQEMAELSKELEKYQKAEKEAEAKKNSSSGGLWGFIAGPAPPPPASS
ncbi:MAG: hypothetical protein WDW36_007522 [Sanguina aurantia]